MGMVIKPKYTELYGKYDDLNKFQIEYIKIITDPNNRLKKITDQEIADMLGVDKKSVYNYRQNPIIRKAINEEVMLKATDDFPDMIRDLLDMAMGRGIHEDIPPHTRFKAKELWLKVNGFIKEAKQKDIDGHREKMSSLDKALMNIERSYTKDIGETEE